MFEFFFRIPCPEKRRLRLLQEAINTLMDTEASLENAIANVAAMRARVQRLSIETPAESVAIGDIAQCETEQPGIVIPTLGNMLGGFTRPARTS